MSTLPAKVPEDRLRHRKKIFDYYMSIGGPKTEDDLKFIIKEFFGFVLPEKVFTEGHTSPFQMVSELFFEKITSAIALANRTGGKTRDVSLLNFLDMAFKGVEVGLAAATLDQSNKGYRYLCEYLDIEEVYPMVIRSIKSFTELENGGCIEIHTGTVKGFNSGHPNKLAVDEVELIEQEVLEEAFSMSMSQDGYESRDLFISTRKRSSGTMQTLINEAKQRGLKLYKWNIWDVLEKCERKCFGDPKYGDCPAYENCQGIAHEVPGSYYPLKDFIKKASLLSKFTWETQWLCKKGSDERRVYSEEWFKEDVNVITWDEFLSQTGFNSKINVDWTRFKHFGGIDFGTVFVYLHFAEFIPTKRRFLVWEYYCNEDRLLESHAQYINSCPYWRPGIPVTRFYDPSGKQEAFELKNDKINPVRGLALANNSIEPGYNTVRRWFKDRELFIVGEEAPNTLREIVDYVFPTDSFGNILNTVPIGEDDHCMDAKRYGVYGTHLGIRPDAASSVKARRVKGLR